MAQRITIAVVESDALYRDLLRTALTGVAAFEVVGTFSDGEAARRSMCERPPDVAVIDVDLRGPLTGIQVGMMVKTRAPQMGVVWLADRFQPYVTMALDRTVTTGWSYLLRQSTTFTGLTRAIEGAARGLVVRDSHPAHGAFGRRRNGLEITPRQGEILALMAAGFTNTAIAEMLHLRGKSIENQINQLYQRLQIEPGDALVQPRVRAVLAYAEKFAASGPLETAQAGV